MCLLELGEKLKFLRNSLNLTQKQVADALGIERSAYTYYEKGTTKPKIKTLSLLARMYNISVDELLELDIEQGEIMRVKSNNPVVDNWTSSDKFNELSDYEQSVLIRLRLLSGEDKKKVIADYMENQNYSETARINNVGVNTVKRLVLSQDNEEMARKSKEKKDITHKDLRKAITVMQMKHKNCRWKSEKIRSKNS